MKKYVLIFESYPDIEVRDFETLKQAEDFATSNYLEQYTIAMVYKNYYA